MLMITGARITNHAEKQERSPEHLRGEEQRQHVAARRQGAEESDCRLRHRWLRKELEEAIQSEHDEDQPEQDPRDSHRRLHSISSVAARLRGGMAPRRPVAPSSTGDDSVARLGLDRSGRRPRA